MNTLIEQPETILPTEAQRQAARDALEILTSIRGPQDRVMFVVADSESSSEMASLPAPAMKLLRKILGEMMAGNAVEVVAIPKVMSAHQAADFLKVSRPYVIQLLESNKLSCHTTAIGPGIHLRDLIDFNSRSDVEREAALVALVAEAQELNMGY